MDRIRFNAGTARRGAVARTLSAAVLAAVASVTASGDFTGVSAEVHLVDTPAAGYRTYRLYANFDDHADQLLAMGGDPASGPLVFSTDCPDGLFNDGGPFDGMKQEDFANAPLAPAHDSWITIEHDQFEGNDTEYTPRFLDSWDYDPPRAVIVGSYFEEDDSGWYDINPGTPALPDGSGRILIAQFTFRAPDCGFTLSGCVHYQPMGSGLVTEPFLLNVEGEDPKKRTCQTCVIPDVPPLPEGAADTPVVYVWNDMNHTPVPPYRTWETAAYGIQTGIDTAPAGGTVRVRCTETPYAGGLVIDEDDDGMTLVSETGGGGEVPVITGGTHVITVRDTEFQTTIRGFIIEAGGAQDVQDGAGIYARDANVRIVANCIRDNVGRNGGGVALERSTGSIDFNLVTSNTASENGGGIALIDCDDFVVVADNVVREENAAQDDGGGIHIDDCVNVSLSRNLIEENSAEYGGGLALDDSIDVFISQTHFLMNEAGHGGGGVHVQSSKDVMITTCLARMNHADIYGGGIGVQAILGPVYGKTDIVATVFDENTAGLSSGPGVLPDGFGGGLAVVGAVDSMQALAASPSLPFGPLALYGGGAHVEVSGASMFTMNEARSQGKNARGGGIYVGGGLSLAVLRGCIVSGNASDGDGGGITVFNGAFVLAVENNMFIGNTAKDDGGGANHGTCSLGIWKGTRFESNEATQGNGGGMHISLGDGTQACRARIDLEDLCSYIAAFVSCDNLRSVVLEGNHFIENQAKSRGGGLSLRNARAKCSGNQFIGNVTDGDGGGVAALSSDQQIGTQGEGPLTSGPFFLQMNGDVLIGNIAGKKGGALSTEVIDDYPTLMDDSTCSLTGLEVALNTAGMGQADARAAGIFLEGQPLNASVDGCAFMNHSGAGLTVTAKPSSVLPLATIRVGDACVFDGNQVGLLIEKADVDVTGALFSDNNKGPGRTAHIVLGPLDGDFVRIQSSRFVSTPGEPRTVRAIDIRRSGDDVTISGSDFSGHMSPAFAVYVRATDENWLGNPKSIDAEDNFWNDAGGPHAPPAQNNPAGDRVSPLVDFTPWLAAPPP